MSGQHPEMATSEPRRSRTLRGIERPDAATRSMLAGLATLHPLVMAIDSRGRLTWLRDRLDIVTRHAEDLIGGPVSTLLRELRPDDLDASESRTRRFIQEMRERGLVTRARIDVSHDGGSLPLEVSAFSIHDASGNKLFVCIADRHELRESLERKNEDLETFVRGVSHDLRSPLVSLLGFSRLLRDDYRESLDHNGLHFVNRIEHAGRHMEKLLDDMLEFSRIGEANQCRVHVHPGPVLDQLHSELKLQLDENDIELRLPENPPTLLCDRTRLYQLFSNLIGNAIHHMGRRGSGRIEVEIDRVEGGSQISIADNGRGISPENFDRIFDVFETAGRSEAGKRHSGFGLAIVKKIVETQSGRVWVESEPGKGARFVVWLPTG